MEFTKIKNIDQEASRICLGTWSMGGWLWGGSDKKQCIKTIYKAIDLGINIIDTAPVYGFGLSEEIVGEAISETGSRHEIIIATKAGLEWNKGNVFRNSSIERILKEIDDSLKRLRTDYIDLYQIHWPDPLVPIEETAELMSSLLKEGKIRSVGVSNYSPEQMKLFMNESELHTSQPPYNLFERGIDTDVLPYCKENGITMLLYGVLCRGLLSGKLKTDSEFKGDDIRNFDPKFKDDVFKSYLTAVENLNSFARDTFGKNVLHLSVRWVLDSCKQDIALWGARNPEQLSEVNQITGWSIDSDLMINIERIINDVVKTPIGPEFMAPGPRPGV
ncbi:MAG: aldo/keto reductase [Thermodesulfobacteriota bacterium]